MQCPFTVHLHPSIRPHNDHWNRRKHYGNLYSPQVRPELHICVWWTNMHHHNFTITGAGRCRQGPTCTSATWRCRTSSSAAWRPPWRPSQPSPGPGTWAPSSAASSPLSRSQDDWWCHNWRMMFQCTSVYMSTMSLTAVAVDRCMAVSTSPGAVKCESSKISICVTSTYSLAGWWCQSSCCDIIFVLDTELCDIHVQVTWFWFKHWE